MECLLLDRTFRDRYKICVSEEKIKQKCLPPSRLLLVLHPSAIVLPCPHNQPSSSNMGSDLDFALHELCS